MRRASRCTGYHRALRLWVASCRGAPSVSRPGVNNSSESLLIARAGGLVRRRHNHSIPRSARRIIADKQENFSVELWLVTLFRLVPIYRKGGRSGFGALLVCFYRRGKLVYAGKVGTGYDSATLQRLARQLAQLERATCPFVGDGLPRRGVHWVKPKLVAQIGFTEWTPAEKLRHPRFLGLRQDKKPEEVVREG